MFGGIPASKHDSKRTNHLWIQILKPMGLLSTLQELYLVQNATAQERSYITSTLQAALVARGLVGAFQDAGYHL